MNAKHSSKHPREGGQRVPRIGIDIGRVIIAGGVGTADTAFFGHDHDSAMATPSMPGAFEAVAELVDAFDRRAWLVSKCGPRIRARSLAWLDHHDFWARTGLPREQVRFCRDRKDKAIHAKRLALTHFIDDRYDVLRHLVGLVDHLYLFGEQNKTRRPSDSPAFAAMTPTRSWAELLELVDRPGARRAS